MPINQTLLPEFDQEMANTRKTLALVPDDKLDWRPHRKSWTMRELASHVANLPTWTAITLNQDSIDVAPREGGQPQQVPVGSQKELLERFDQNIMPAREAIASASDEQFMKPWTLLSGGEKVFTMPRSAVLRSFVLNHMIHHRAQLGIYLRLIDVPLPAIYGPSADDSGM